MQLDAQLVAGKDPVLAFVNTLVVARICSLHEVLSSLNLVLLVREEAPFVCNFLGLQRLEMLQDMVVNLLPVDVLSEYCPIRLQLRLAELFDDSFDLHTSRKDEVTKAICQLRLLWSYGSI